MFNSLEENASVEALDSKARRSAARVDLKVKKSRWRPGSDCNRGGFQLVSVATGAIIEGFWFELSPEDVIEHCADIERRWLESERASYQQQMQDDAAAIGSN
jgi:hypothetical protein